MKFKDGIKEKNIIIKCGADRFLPFAVTFGLYVILFGTVSPGGQPFPSGVDDGFASAALLLYLGYGYNVVTRVIHPETLRIGEALGAALYVILGAIGIAAGANFCRNIFFDNGEVGEMISAGTITFMSYTVGFKVLTGVGFLLLLMLGLLAPDADEDTPSPAAVTGSIANAGADETAVAESTAAPAEEGKEAVS